MTLVAIKSSFCPIKPSLPGPPSRSCRRIDRSICRTSAAGEVTVERQSGAELVDAGQTGSRMGGRGDGTTLGIAMSSLLSAGFAGGCPDSLILRYRKNEGSDLATKLKERRTAKVRLIYGVCHIVQICPLGQVNCFVRIQPNPIKGNNKLSVLTCPI